MSLIHNHTTKGKKKIVVPATQTHKLEILRPNQHTWEKNAQIPTPVTVKNDANTIFIKNHILNHSLYSIEE